MVSDKRKLGFTDQSILAMFICLIIFCTGCGPSYEERQAQKEAERKIDRRKIAEIERRFNAVYFPPQEITDTSFTYEIQKFFDVHADQTIVFEGYLEDVVSSENNVLVEFVCLMGEFYFLNKVAVRFRLTFPENNVGEFLKTKRIDSMIPSLRYFSEPDYFVIAKIMNIQRVRKYEFNGSANGEEVAIEAEVSRALVSTGQLVKAIPILKKDESKP